MRMPWVSRGRFEDERERVSRLEEERERLLDRIAALSGQEPLYRALEPGMSTSTTTTLSLAGQEAKDVVPAPERQRGRMTLETVRAAAEAAAARGERKLRSAGRRETANG